MLSKLTSPSPLRRGAGFIEYALLILVAVVVVGIIAVTMPNIVESVLSRLTDAVSGIGGS